MRWQTRKFDSEVASRLVREGGYPPLIAQLLAARGITTVEAAQRFFRPSLSHLHSPYLMSGMQAAIERLSAAIERKEKILIYGDYDVDGTVAVVILKTAIELCGGTADYHVPHRIKEGYGMRDEVIERAAGEGVQLIISVDTGIRAFAAAEAAARVGVDLIVTDHHLPEANEGVPKALAVLNPNQQGCAYPCKALCGAGVAFKIVQALLEKNGKERLLPSFIKMVAIATVADSVPLVDENRVIVKLGLDGLRQPVNGGLKALLDVSAVAELGRPLTATDIAFRLAPRLNAAGRMDVARDVIELFTCKNEAREKELAAKLNQLNADRQQEEARIIEAANERIDSDEKLRDSYCLVVDGEAWHRGVIGIVATRVVERYGRPALVVSCENGEAHGSGRSISNFHLLEALESCREVFTRFGGHAHAVGFALPTERVPLLRERLDAYARTRLTLADFEPVTTIDAVIDFDEITPELFRTVQQLAPFGMANPEPVFGVRGAKVVQPPKILKDKHVKLRVMNPEAKGRAYDALGWRMLEDLQAANVTIGSKVDIAFTIEENQHPEFGGLQLCLASFSMAEAAAAQ